jgi:hypothetical protein
MIDLLRPGSPAWNVALSTQRTMLAGTSLATVGRPRWGVSCRWRVAAFLILPITASAAEPRGTETLPSGKIEWTRLITHSPYWNRHAESDSRLLTYLATHTPLTVDPQLRSTSPRRLEDLCHFPFIYAHDISSLPENEARNLAEYLKRGGFLMVDFCANVHINPAPKVFLGAQLAKLNSFLPDIRVEELRPEHEVFSIFFRMRHFPPQTRPGDSPWVDGKTNPLCAFYCGDRLVAIVGLSAFQCAWSGVGPADNANECMQMLANIYVYAMTH